MMGAFVSIFERNEPKVEVFTQVKYPRQYVVCLLNDDYTPMDFVVEVLQHFFHFSEASAVRTMLEVHLLGKGVCGLYTRDIAETKVMVVNEFSRNKGHPLLCTMEPG